MVMLGRALGIEPIENPNLTQFTDGAQVASYARGMLAALIRAGIVGGVTARPAGSSEQHHPRSHRHDS